MDKKGIIEGLEGYNQIDVEKFASGCMKALEEKDRDKALKNPWMGFKTNQNMIDAFKFVDSIGGLIFDWVNVTMTSTGITYNHVAYKNRMLFAYPETKIDNSLVYKGDKFSFSKEDGKILYDHQISDPFGHKDADIIGAYAIIKNRRGEFLVTLSPEEIEKRRKVAKTDSIWKAWFPEMCMKTVVKKACSEHFRDIVQKMEESDNENNDLSKLDEVPKWEAEIDQIEDLEKLREYWRNNKGKGKAFDRYVLARSEQLKALISSNTKANDNAGTTEPGTDTGTTTDAE